MIVGSDIGLLSSIGCSIVDVYNIPRIGILSTGDELSDASMDTIPRGNIIDSNRPMIKSTIRSLYPYSTIIDLGISRDVKQDILNKITEGLDKCDVIITSG